MERKVKFKQWVLDELNANKNFHKGHYVSVKSRCIFDKSESYDFRFTKVPYLIVDDDYMDMEKNEYVVIGPVELKSRGYLVIPDHVEPYDEFPELDDLFEWE